MSRKEKIIVLITNTLLGVGTILLTALLMEGWGIFITVICYVLPSVFLILGLTALILNKPSILKSSLVFTVCVFTVILAISVIGRAAHLSSYATDGEKIERLTQIIRNSGNWGMAVFVLIQILQVVILPLPAVVCYVPGSQIWGAGLATLLASAGVLMGSVIAYCIGRFFGKKAVIWIAGSETCEKYSAYIGNKGKVIFVLMQILPFFPDDILCLVAGLTAMNFPFFICVMVFVRPLVIAAYCYLGNGSIIPFSGWGIPVWIAIFALCIVLAVLSLKYQDRFEKWLVSKFTKKNKLTSAEGEENGDFGEDKEKDGEEHINHG